MVGQDGQARVKQTGELNLGHIDLVTSLPRFLGQLDHIVLQAPHRKVQGHFGKVHHALGHLVVGLDAQQGVGPTGLHRRGLGIEAAVLHKLGAHPIPHGGKLPVGLPLPGVGTAGSGTVCPVLGVGALPGKDFRPVHRQVDLRLEGEVFLVGQQLLDGLLIAVISIDTAKGRRGGHCQNQHPGHQTEG